MRPMSNRHVIARILIVDDQRDVLERLRLLLKAEGLACSSADDPARGARRGEEVSVRRGADRSQLHARHDIRRRRSRASERAQASSMPICRSIVMTAWGIDRSRRRGDAPGRRRFHREAVGQPRLMSVLRNQISLAARAATRAAPESRRTRSCAARTTSIHRRIAARCSACWRRSIASRRPMRTC